MARSAALNVIIAGVQPDFPGVERRREQNELNHFFAFYFFNFPKVFFGFLLFYDSFQAAFILLPT